MIFSTQNFILDFSSRQIKASQLNWMQEIYCKLPSVPCMATTHYLSISDRPTPPPGYSNSELSSCDIHLISNIIHVTFPTYSLAGHLQFCVKKFIVSQTHIYTVKIGCNFIRSGKIRYVWNHPKDHQNIYQEKHKPIKNNP